MLIVSHLLEQNKNSNIFHDCKFCEFCYICKISKSEALVMVQWVRYLLPSLIISDLREASRTEWWKKIINSFLSVLFFKLYFIYNISPFTFFPPNPPIEPSHLWFQCTVSVFSQLLSSVCVSCWNYLCVYNFNRIHTHAYIYFILQEKFLRTMYSVFSYKWALSCPL